MNRSLELKVGLFTLAMFLLFAWLVVRVESYQPFKKVYTLKVTFHDVQRLAVGDAVRLNGLPVGKVREMKLKEGLVQVWLEIEKGFDILKDSKIAIGTAGFFGANYIKISQPVLKQRGEPPQYLLDGQEVAGSEEAGIDKLVEEGQNILASARVTFDALNKILGDPDFRRDITRTARNLELTTRKAQDVVGRIDRKIEEVAENVRKFSSNLNTTMEENRPALKRSLEDLEKLLAELRGTAADNRKDMRKLVTNLADFADGLNGQGETARRLREAIERLDQLVEDYGTSGPIGSEVASSAKNITALTSDLRTVTHKARDFVTDPRTSDKVDQVVEDVHELSSQSRDLGGEIDKFKFDLRSNTLYNFDREKLQSDILAVAGYDDRYFAYVGHEHIGRAQGLNTVQLGTRLWDDFIVRSGSILDKNGLGVDAELFDRKAMFSVEGFRFRDPLFRAIGRYRINDDFNLMVRHENLTRPDSRTLLGVEHHF